MIKKQKLKIVKCVMNSECCNITGTHCQIYTMYDDKQQSKEPQLEILAFPVNVKKTNR